MPYDSMQILIGWNGLCVPTMGCSVHMLIVIINFKVSSVRWDQ